MYIEKFTGKHVLPQNLRGGTKVFFMDKYIYVFDKPEMDMSCIISIDGTGHSERGGGYIKNRYSLDTLAKMSQNIFFYFEKKKIVF